MRATRGYAPNMTRASRAASDISERCTTAPLPLVALAPRWQAPIPEKRLEASSSNPKPPSCSSSSCPPPRTRLGHRDLQTSRSAGGEIFGDPVAAANMIVRLVHHAEFVSFKGDHNRLKDRDLGGCPTTNPTDPTAYKGSIFNRRRWVNFRPPLTTPRSRAEIRRGAAPSNECVLSGSWALCEFDASRVAPRFCGSGRKGHFIRRPRRSKCSF